MPTLSHPISFLLGAIVIISTRYLSKSHALKIWRALTTTSADLQFSPTQLTSVDVIFIFLVVLSKSFLRLLGRLPRLKPSPNNEGFALPEIRFSAPLNVSQADRDNYEKALALLKLHGSDHDSDRSKRDSLSLLLASLTTPLMLMTVAHFKSPIIPFGAVNTKNRFEFISPQRCSQCPDVLTVTSRSGGAKYPGRRTRRGIEFDVVIEVFGPKYAGSRAVEANPVGWSVIFRQVVTVMQTLSKHTKPLYREDTGKQDQGLGQTKDGFTLMKQIDVPSYAPSAWATVCRDYNPIHMSALAGRSFGLPGRIAHGNHVAAAALALASPEEPSTASSPSAVNVFFKRPLVLPASIQIGVTQGGSSMAQFRIFQNAKPTIEGNIEPFDDQRIGKSVAEP